MNRQHITVTFSQISGHQVNLRGNHWFFDYQNNDDYLASKPCLELLDPANLPWVIWMSNRLLKHFQVNLQADILLKQKHDTEFEHVIFVGKTQNGQRPAFYHTAPTENLAIMQNCFNAYPWLYNNRKQPQKEAHNLDWYMNDPVWIFH